MIFGSIWEELSFVIKIKFLFPLVSPQCLVPGVLFPIADPRDWIILNYFVLEQFPYPLYLVCWLLTASCPWTIVLNFCCFCSYDWKKPTCLEILNSNDVRCFWTLCENVRTSMQWGNARERNPKCNWANDEDSGTQAKWGVKNAKIPADPWAPLYVVDSDSSEHANTVGLG